MVRSLQISLGFNLSHDAAELSVTPAAGRVSIGGTSIAVVDPHDWCSVPYGIGKALPATDEILRHLKWMMEKDRLGQDMFLIG